MTRFVALLRGINVGTAKAVDMADLRACFESLGLDSVRTVLRSGNVVFDSPRVVDAVALEMAILEATGVSSAVVIVEHALFRKIVTQNPLASVSVDPSRALIHFLAGPADVTEARRPTDTELLPERLAITPHAIYQWCPEGISKSRIPVKFFSSLGTTATARNLRTVDKLVALLDAS